MSLLMDALKKAEQAKQGEAGADVSSRPVAPTAPEQPTTPSARQVSDAPRIELTLEEPEPKHVQVSAENTADELTLQDEADAAQMADRSLPDDDPAPVVEQPLAEPQQLPPESAPALETEAGARAAVTEPVAAAPAPAPSPVGQAAASASSESKGWAMADDKPAAVRRVMPTPDPQQAQRTFLLKSRAAARRKRLLLFALGGIVILSLGGGGYYYIDRALNTLDSASLVVANGFVAQAPVADSATLTEVMVDEAGEAEMPMQEVEASSGSASMQATAPVEQYASAVQAAPIPPAPQTQVSALPAATAPVTAPVNPPAETGASGVAADRPAPQARIRIVRTQTTDPSNRLLLEAYQAYQAGNHALAISSYEKVLQQDASNRDALLGLAAIAYGNGEHDRAAAYYTMLLKLDPRDSAAISGLVTLHGAGLTVENESRIKMLLDQEPKAAHLHFTLGGLYAEQSRWADAQDSFFNAHRYAPENADYAYNLAVSLDRIGKREAALEYYRRAVRLAGGQRAIFNLSEAGERINALSGLADTTR